MPARRAILIAVEPVPPPAADSITFDLDLLGPGVEIEPAVEMPSASADPNRSRTRFVFAAPGAEPRWFGELEVETAYTWLARARAAAAEDVDPTVGLVAAIDGVEPLALDALPDPAVDAGYATVLRARPLSLDFVDGSGVRYLAGLTDAYAPLTDRDLLYVFEGLTTDGRYHVALRISVTAAVLMAGPELATLEDSLAFAEDTDAYVLELTDRLARAEPGSFSPSLEQLDAFVRSLAIR
ncbi:MAG TPA: hypothetical protein VLT59_03095 [Steroidobacteraceae bacterium]|nr:hypothetical protein [Steroidobacteraceae bacterium]